MVEEKGGKKECKEPELLCFIKNAFGNGPGRGTHLPFPEK